LTLCHLNQFVDDDDDDDDDDRHRRRIVSELVTSIGNWNLGFPFLLRESLKNGNIHGVIREQEQECSLLQGNGREWELTMLQNSRKYNTFSHEFMTSSL